MLDSRIVLTSPDAEFGIWFGGESSSPARLFGFQSDSSLVATFNTATNVWRLEAPFRIDLLVYKRFIVVDMWQPSAEVLVSPNDNVKTAFAVALDITNEYRARHVNTPTLAYGPVSIENEFTQQWANHLRFDPILAHSSYPDLGENIAFVYGNASSPTPEKDVIKEAFRLFYYEEINNYYSPRSNGGVTGHFTQIFWKGSKTMTFAYAIDSNTNRSRDRSPDPPSMLQQDARHENPAVNDEFMTDLLNTLTADADAHVDAPADAPADAFAEALFADAPADAPVEAPADAFANAHADAFSDAPAHAFADAHADAIFDADADAFVDAVFTDAPVEAPVEAPADGFADAPIGMLLDTYDWLRSIVACLTVYVTLREMGKPSAWVMSFSTLYKALGGHDNDGNGFSRNCRVNLGMESTTATNGTYRFNPEIAKMFLAMIHSVWPGMVIQSIQNGDLLYSLGMKISKDDLCVKKLADKTISNVKQPRTFNEWRGKASYRNKGVHALLVGAYEGRVLQWLIENVLTGPKDTAFVLDPFDYKPCVYERGQAVWNPPENVRNTLQQVVDQSGGKATVLPPEAASLACLVMNTVSLDAKPSGGGGKYNFIYIDAHDSVHALESGVHAMRLLNPSGIIVFQNYVHNQEHDTNCPRIGIDAFISTNSRRNSRRNTTGREVLAALKFNDVVKKSLKYAFVPERTDLEPMTFTIAKRKTKITTKLGNEMSNNNVAMAGDIIICGAYDERYVVTFQKILTMYDIVDGQLTVRAVTQKAALYKSNTAHTFTAPWGESMTVHSGDYIVKEGEDDDDGFYRVEKNTFEQMFDIDTANTSRNKMIHHPTKKSPNRNQNQNQNQNQNRSVESKDSSTFDGTVK
eukprot:gene17334-biopygen26258